MVHAERNSQLTLELLADLKSGKLIQSEKLDLYDPLNPPILTTPAERAVARTRARWAASDASAAQPGTLVERIHEQTFKLGVFRR